MIWRLSRLWAGTRPAPTLLIPVGATLVVARLWFVTSLL